MTSAFMLGATHATPKASPHDSWVTVFRDDFSGKVDAGPDKGNWIYDYGTGYIGGADHWGTGEIEHMTDRPENVSLDGAGNLAITPRRDSNGEWTSGRIESKAGFAAPEDGKLRVEASIRLPDVEGRGAAGYWPAFWLLGEEARPVGATNWPKIGEWDVMENVNGRNSFFSTLHCGFAPGGPCNEFSGLSSGEQWLPSVKTQFHTYAIEYDRSSSPETLRWYLDGVNYYTLSEDQVVPAYWEAANRHGFNIIFNVAMGGSFPEAFGGRPTFETDPGHPMLVDHVAVLRSS